MNVNEIYSESGRLLNDPNNTRWTTTVLLARINMSTPIIQGYTNAIKTKETLTAVADTQEVSLNSNTLDITRVAMTMQNGDIRPLTGVTRKELDYIYPN
jgi:hypothetical protein